MSWNHPQQPELIRQRVTTGMHVILTNPNYPDLRFEGEFVSGAIAGEPSTHSYSTFTVRDAEGTLHRSEGVLSLPLDPEPFRTLGGYRHPYASRFRNHPGMIWDPRPGYEKNRAPYVV